MPPVEHQRQAQHAQTVARRNATRQAVVGAIVCRNDAVTARWIIQCSGRSKSTVARCLNDLMNDGIVERFPDPHDGREFRYRMRRQSDGQA